MKLYLLPWKQVLQNSISMYIRQAHNEGIVYSVIYSNNKWWAWSDDIGDNISCETAEEAMNAADDCFRKRGDVLLTEETMLLL